MYDEKFIGALAAQLAPMVAAKLKDQLETKIAPRYLDQKQAAQYLGTSEGAVRGMLRAKRFPVSKVGAKIYIDVKEIDKAMAEEKMWLTS